VGSTTCVSFIDTFSFVCGKTRFTVAALVPLGIAILVYLYVEILAHSPFSRMLKAIRDAEVAVNIYGKDIVKAGAQTLIIGDAIAAVAGALWALYTGSMKAATTYTRLTWTFWPWAFMRLGRQGITWRASRRFAIRSGENDNHNLQGSYISCSRNRASMA
jgi:branched-chain amino acid transport system permease protein